MDLIRILQSKSKYQLNGENIILNIVVSLKY